MFGLDKLHRVVHDLGSDIKDKLSGNEQGHKPSQAGYGKPSAQSQHPHQPGQEHHLQHRFSSFAPQRQGNDIKWYVDGYVHLPHLSRLALCLPADIE